MNFGGREGFIPAPEDTVFRRVCEFPDYPYLRKYPSRKRQFDGNDGEFFSTTIDALLLKNLRSVELLIRQGNREAGALAHFRLRRNAAGMALDDAVNDGKPDTGALEFVISVQSFRNRKQSVGMLHIESSTVVADHVDRFAFVVFSMDVYACILSSAGELESIREEIFEQLPQQQRIGPGIRKRAYLKRNLSRRFHFVTLTYQLVYQIADLHTLFCQRLMHQTRQAQQAIDESQLSLTAVEHIAEEFFLFHVQWPWLFLDEKFGKANDLGCGRAQIV
jgi:hypothetical protein